jgi:corrinoid protein of di/trimethylamine methyltransferase
MPDDLFAAMRQSVVDGAPGTATELAQRALAAGLDPLEAIDRGFLPGIHHVGEEYARRAMFLPDMMAASEAMKAAIAVLDPALKQQGGERTMLGTVVLGTARGDIHEIGKVLVGTILSAHGFQVHDLGVDVPAETFAAKAGELDADVVGVSALLTTTMGGQQAVIAALERAGLRPKVKVIIGGAPVTRQWAEQIGADGYGKDAVGSVALVKHLLQK